MHPPTHSDSLTLPLYHTPAHISKYTQSLTPNNSLTHTYKTQTHPLPLSPSLSSTHIHTVKCAFTHTCTLTHICAHTHRHTYLALLLSHCRARTYTLALSPSLLCPHSFCSVSHTRIYMSKAHESLSLPPSLSLFRPYLPRLHVCAHTLTHSCTHTQIRHPPDQRSLLLPLSPPTLSPPATRPPSTHT